MRDEKVEATVLTTGPYRKDIWRKTERKVKWVNST